MCSSFAAEWPGRIAITVQLRSSRRAASSSFWYSSKSVILLLYQIFADMEIPFALYGVRGDALGRMVFWCCLNIGFVYVSDASRRLPFRRDHRAFRVFGQHAVEYRPDFIA